MNNETSFNPHNMFICKTEILKKYYNEVFPWLEKCESQFGFNDLEGYGLKRIYGFLAERFLSYWFKKNYKVKELPIIVKNLSDYKDYPFKDTPFPKRDFLPEKSVINNQMFEKYGSPKATMVYFSRGCFYRCSYCVYNVPNSLQVKSKERMLEEINYLKEIYGVEAILLKDEIAINPKKELFQNQMDAI